MRLGTSDAAAPLLPDALVAFRLGTLFCAIILRLPERLGVDGRPFLSNPGSRGSGFSETEDPFSKSRSFHDLDGGRISEVRVSETCSAH